MTRKEKRNQEIIRLRNQGTKLEEIGARYGITRQRVQQIVGPTREKLRDQMEQKLLDYYHKTGGCTADEMSKVLGISGSYASKLYIELALIGGPLNTRLASQGKRRCNMCGDIKPLDDFIRDRGHWTGRGKRCLVCNAEYVREWNRRKRTTSAPRSEVSPTNLAEPGH